MAAFKLFLMSLKMGAESARIEDYISSRLSVSDPAQVKNIIYDAPSLLVETDDPEEAASIKSDLEALGARVELKRIAVSQTLPPAEAVATPPVKPESASLYGEKGYIDPPPPDFTAPRRSTSKYVIGALAVIMAGLIVWELHIFMKYVAELRVPPRKPVIISDDGAPAGGLEWRVSVEKRDIATPRPKVADEELLKVEKLINSGSLDEAVDALERRLVSQPDDSGAMDLLLYTHILLADKYFDNKDYEGALEHLTRAGELAPERADIMARMGFINFYRKNYSDAEHYFNEALRDGYETTDLHYALAIIYYYHDDDMYLAERHLDKAIKNAPGRADILALKAKIERDRNVEDGMERATGLQFIVKYDGIKDEDAGYTVLYTLEDAYNAIGYDLGEYPQAPITVILYTQSQFRQVTNLPHWAGGLYDGRIRLPVGGLPDRNDDNLKRLLYHEYTHAVIHRITNGKCPVWLNEGMAQLMQERSGASKDPWLKVDIFQSGAVMTLDSLSRPFLKLDAADAQIAYIESYYAVQYLTQEYGMSGAANLLEEIGEGKSLDKAFRNLYAVDFKTFEDRFYEHLKTMVE